MQRSKTFFVFADCALHFITLDKKTASRCGGFAAIFALKSSVMGFDSGKSRLVYASVKPIPARFSAVDL
jgi:hypothetical protein